MTNNLAAYLIYAEYALFEMNNAWDKIKFGEISTMIAYHHWLNQDDLTNLIDRLQYKDRAKEQISRIQTI